jgi:outer membrane protein assembly factor BamA
VIYAKVGKKSYFGAGVNLNYRFNIFDKNLTSTFTTAHYNYSVEKGFNPSKYFANGVVFAYQYNSREHPLRSYGGIYSEVGLQVNTRFLGSSKNAVQFYYDFRKYWSLSKRYPMHVIALWSLGSIQVGGKLPYLELPNTSSDFYYRSGRGYTIGRFRGPSYFYFESEYRFPITRNKLLSGVAFINTATTSNSQNKDFFRFFGTAAGVGLRILFQKAKRTVICADYARGEYGAYGIYFGLNEVF